MPSKLGPEDLSIDLKFGGGVHSRASENEIHIRECSVGENFNLDLQNKEYTNRKPFDLIGLVPNGAEIRGFANLVKVDGSISVLVQAGGIVYEWDGATTFTQKGTCAATAKLRGRLEHIFQLDDKVIITDLSLAQDVMEWDGSTLQDVTFTDETVSGFFGTFRAKYCIVQDERAIFANIHDNGTDFEHLIVGSKRSDFTQITVVNLPSSAISIADPFYMLAPDLKAINGMVQGFGLVVISSRDGNLYKLTGTSAQDFQFLELYPRSSASGDESIATIGNDILYGRRGRIESLVSTDKFGDVEADDLSVSIADSIETFKDWSLTYNARKQRVYCVPDSQAQMWVYHNALRGTELSPWSKWTTIHSMNFQPTAIMNMLDPSDGLEYVFMGDADGNFYRMEGSGTSGDGGIDDITVTRTSALFQAPIDAELYNLHGWVKYRKNKAFTIKVTVLFSGVGIFSVNKTISPSAASRNVYNGSTYYGTTAHYGTFSGKITRKDFGVEGQSSQFQIKTEIAGSVDFNIIEIGFKFSASTK